MGETFMKKIFVVEDEPSQAELLRAILERQGEFDVVFFKDGLLAYEHIQDNLPELLILDIILPTLSGLAITRLLKFHARYKHIPILVISSITDPDLENRAAQAGADALIPKPIQINLLLSEITRISSG